MSLVRGDAADDLYNQGITALQAEQYDVAAKAFDSIVTGYPLTPNIDEVRIRAGFAYLHAGKYPEAIDRLSKEADVKAKPQYRGTALYFTALAQFTDAQKGTTKSQSDAGYTQAIATFTTLINLVTTAPTPDNKGYLEQSIYYRSLAYFLKADYAGAEKDLLQVIQQFPSSLSRPDYYLRLGSVYAVQTNLAVAAKPPNPSAVSAMADKALAAFDNVSRDPNALVQANDANMSKAEILFLTAQLDAISNPGSTAGYEKALDAYRQVRRKDDMIPLQQKRLDDLRKAAQAQAAASAQAPGGVGALGSDSSLLIGREQNRLKDLQDGTDPIIQALMRMAECYVSMKQPNEARTILHRLIAHAGDKLTPDQQKELDFQVLYSYVLGGQVDQANKALDDYLAKHTGDPQADSLSLQIGSKLMERGDFNGALAQANRSLKDFSNGKYIADVIGLKARALTALKRIPESDAVVDDFLKSNPTSPAANGMFYTKAQGESSRGDFAGAMRDYAKVKDNASADAKMRGAAAAAYIMTLNSLKKYDEIIAETKTFQTQYAADPALPTVLLYNGMALDQKHDPGAVAALQDVARKFPKDQASPFALAYVLTVYQRANNVPLMIQAAADLRKAFPEAYTQIAQAADMVSAILIKQKKFDDAIALYQPLTESPKPDVAAAAHNKIASIWLASAKSLGYYQSMALPTRAEAEKRLAAAEQAYVATLKAFPDQLAAVGEAFDGLVTAAKQRRSWGLLKDADLEGYLTKVGADLTTPDLQARLEMAKAGLVFITKDGAKDFPVALDRFRKVMGANASLHLTRQEADQYGELLLAAKDYANAEKTYTELLNNADPADNQTPSYAYFGLGATSLAQNKVAQAKDYFVKVGGWHPHIAEANFGIALADEQSGQPADLDAARQIYTALMTNQQAGPILQTKAMLGCGRLLEKSGNGIKPSAQNESAVHYYQQPHILFGPASPAASAEGLYDAGQVYSKAGDKVSAKKQYDDLIKAYSATAPDWAAKAQAANQ